MKNVWHAQWNQKKNHVITDTITHLQIYQNPMEGRVSDAFTVSHIHKKSYGSPNTQ